jgi:hypothetical protein
MRSAVISQAQLKEQIRKLGGTVYFHKEKVGLVQNGRNIFGVGCVRIDPTTACDIRSDGSASCWDNGMNYIVSPGIIVPAAEAPLATEEDEERTKKLLDSWKDMDLNLERKKS